MGVIKTRTLKCSQIQADRLVTMSPRPRTPATSRRQAQVAKRLTGMNRTTETHTQSGPTLNEPIRECPYPDAEKEGTQPECWEYRRQLSPRS
jgi:hypothetical protein